MPTLIRRRFLQAAGASLALVSIKSLGQDANSERVGKKLKVNPGAPYNAEPAVGAISVDWRTPLESFYVRSHGKTMPDIDPKDYRLEISGLVEKPLSYSLAELKARFKQSTSTATLTCAGNRRSEHSATKMVNGVQWEAGAIGNANWEGPKLLSVLQSAGLKSDAKHVWFEGHDDVDHGGHTVKFGGSIPLEKLTADDDSSGPLFTPPPLLAHRMNREPLLIEHGFPLRAIVPGYIGARSVKWLAKIVVSDRPSPNPFLAESYKIVKTADSAEAAKAEPIYRNVINCAIASRPMNKVAAGKVSLTGYALPSGIAEAKIKSVEVSLDGGKNWTAAKYISPPAAYCWQLWYANLDLKPGKHTILARATDTTGAAMPEKTPWNAKGYLYNGWHKIELEAV